jgi:phage-related protein
MIENFDDWVIRYRINRERDPFRLTPLALGAIFDWCVTAAAVDMEPRVKVAQFGDGYAQRRADGLNYQPQTWNIEMRNAFESTARAAFDFLKARGGVDVFNWYQPRTDIVVNVICPRWSLAYGDLIDSGDRLFNLTATFEETYL